MSECQSGFYPSILSEAAPSLQLSLERTPDGSLLCDFLLKNLKLRQVSQLPDQAIYEIVYLFCWGELLAFVTNAKTATGNFEIFYARILEQIVPARQLSQLQN